MGNLEKKRGRDCADSVAPILTQIKSIFQVGFAPVCALWSVLRLADGGVARRFGWEGYNIGEWWWYTSLGGWGIQMLGVAGITVNG